MIVIGLFDKSYADPSDDSFSHHFRIIPKSIEQLSEKVEIREDVSAVSAFLLHLLGKQADE